LHGETFAKGGLDAAVIVLHKSARSNGISEESRGFQMARSRNQPLARLYRAPVFGPGDSGWFWGGSALLSDHEKNRDEL
jgi:hypothetical protein